MPITDEDGAKCPSSSGRVLALLERRGLAVSACFLFRALVLSRCWSRFRLGFAVGQGLRMLLVCAEFLGAAAIGTCRVAAKWTDLVDVRANVTLAGASLSTRDSQWVKRALRRVRRVRVEKVRSVVDGRRRWLRRDRVRFRGLDRDLQSRPAALTAMAQRDGLNVLQPVVRLVEQRRR